VARGREWLEKHLNVLLELCRYRCGCSALAMRAEELLVPLVLQPPALRMVHSQLALSFAAFGGEEEGFPERSAGRLPT
jgi:hypothetical protein